MGIDALNTQTFAGSLCGSSWGLKHGPVFHFHMLFVVTMIVDPLQIGLFRCQQEIKAIALIISEYARCPLRHALPLVAHQ